MNLDPKKQQVLIVGGTIALVIIGVMTLKRGSGGSGATTVVTGTGGSSPSSEAATGSAEDQAMLNGISGQLAWLSTHMKGTVTNVTNITNITNPTSTPTKTDPKLPVPKGKPTKSTTYTVKAGDTLSGIAAKMGISNWRTILNSNKSTVVKTAESHGKTASVASSGNWIYPGERLVITSAHAVTAAPKKIVHAQPVHKAAVKHPLGAHVTPVAVA